MKIVTTIIYSSVNVELPVVTCRPSRDLRRDYCYRRLLYASDCLYQSPCLSACHSLSLYIYTCLPTHGIGISMQKH